MLIEQAQMDSATQQADLVIGPGGCVLKDREGPTADRHLDGAERMKAYADTSRKVIVFTPEGYRANFALEGA